MKVGIYKEIGGRDLGGGEHMVAVLAEALGRRHDVEIVHHCRDLCRSDFETFSRVNLDGVNLRYVKCEHNPTRGRYEPFYLRHDAPSYSKVPWRRFHQSKAWHAALSAPYEMFINISHWMPPFCHAPRGVLFVLFPLFDRPNRWPWTAAPARANALPERLQRSAYQRARRAYDEWEWQRRMASYQVKASISQYTRHWTRRWWGIDSRIVYPPVEVDFRTAHKANTILSVGRFTTLGHQKKHVEMVTAYRMLKDAGLTGWDYYSVGGLMAGEPAFGAYYEHVRSEGERGGAKVLANVDGGWLRQLFERSKVFWHAAGYGEDDQAYPERMEHFGMSTVEAMAAGCVPVVINKGGQTEIIQHGVNGFLWSTLEELRDYTLVLSRDDSLRDRMSQAARARAQAFSRGEYVSRTLQMLEPLMSGDRARADG